MTLRLGWMTTANGEGSRGMFSAVLNAIETRRLDARFEFVFVNRSRGQTEATDRFLQLVEENKIPLVTLSSRDFMRRNGNAPWRTLRDDFDRLALEQLKPFNPDLCMQAGYMLYAPIMCSSMLILNHHPALPGRAIGMWQGAIWDVIESRATETGSMIHISTTDLDRGPVVSICRFQLNTHQWDPLWKGVEESDATQLRERRCSALPIFKAIREAGILRERPLVVQTLHAISTGKIDLAALQKGDPVAALDLTEVVESSLNESQLAS